MPEPLHAYSTEAARTDHRHLRTLAKPHLPPAHKAWTTYQTSHHQNIIGTAYIYNRHPHLWSPTP